MISYSAIYLSMIERRHLLDLGALILMSVAERRDLGDLGALSLELGVLSHRKVSQDQEVLLPPGLRKIGVVEEKLLPARP